ncbi:MAG: hypothetical protein K0U78_02710 [Actinomycetia bacterium]|nr:hypothetical protein [Actinomycetes bacterium]
MGKPRRHTSVSTLSDPEELAASLPEELRNPNSCRRWNLNAHQHAVADYLRETGVSADQAAGLAPSVSAATGVAYCVVLRDRLTKQPPRDDSRRTTVSALATASDEILPADYVDDWEPPDLSAAAIAEDERTRMEHRIALAVGGRCRELVVPTTTNQEQQEQKDTDNGSRN